MYIEYQDIRERIKERPLWWLDGVPRYSPFSPGDVGVYAQEAALVHTRCQACGQRYDVAVAFPGNGWPLRDTLAWSNDLDVGDPPNACDRDCGGASMGSMEVQILEFWVRDDGPLRLDWRRDPAFERTLSDAKDYGLKGPQPRGWDKLKEAGLEGSFREARSAGNYRAMVTILQAIECERAPEIAHWMDRDRRRDALSDSLIDLSRQRGL
jgi:hypothetical protein